MNPSQNYFTYALGIGFLINFIAYGVIAPVAYPDISKILASDFIILLTIGDLLITPLLVFEVLKMQRRNTYFVLGMVWSIGISPYLIRILF